MSILDVPGARLYYETRGSGPLTVIFPGANGEASIFRRVTEHLATDYTIVAYDRRGFSRSQLDGPQDYDHRLETDADDVRRLIECLGGEPAIVLGCSSGAIVALEVLIRHPSVVSTVVSFEPPAVKELPNGQEWLAFFLSIYELYRQSGIEPALMRFRERAFPEADRQAMAHAPTNEFTLSNANYWFEHELRQYPAVDLDHEALTANADRVMLMAGRESRGYPTYEVTVALGKKLGRDLIELPGGHVGFVTQPAEFARQFVQVLTGPQRDAKT